MLGLLIVEVGTNPVCRSLENRALISCLNECELLCLFWGFTEIDLGTKCVVDMDETQTVLFSNASRDR